MKTLILVSYDIVANRRRARIASELENFGVRVQKSVFECLLTDAQLRELQRRLDRRLRADEDRVRYYRFCPADRRRVHIDGPGSPTSDPDYYMM